MAATLHRPAHSSPLRRPSASPRVCRALFGPVDHAETTRALSVELARLADEDRRRWNFDFYSETPLPGLYDWRQEREEEEEERTAPPMALRLTINHHQFERDQRHRLHSSEGEDDGEADAPDTPDTTGSRGSSDESDCDLESPLDRCVRESGHRYDLRSLHPANQAVDTPASDADASSSRVERLSPITHRSQPDSLSRQMLITDFMKQRKRKLSSGFSSDGLSKKILRGSRAAKAAAAAATETASTAGPSAALPGCSDATPAAPAVQ